MVRRTKKAETAPAARCAIYTRKSTSVGLERDFNSLDAQRDACERYIASQGHQGWQALLKHYDDGGFTGANLERPGFEALMEDIKAGKVDVVVVYKVDRLSRSLLNFAQVMDCFNQAGVSFVSVTQNFSTADAIGKLTLNMLMSFAEFEREMIAERTRDKIAAERRRGKWTGGTVPFGYRRDGRSLVVDELEALVVREVFDLYLEHRSALTVTRIINERQRPTRRRTMRDGRLCEERQWNKPAVLYLLRNPIYAGYMPHGDELYEGEQEAVIDRETFARVGALVPAKGASTVERTRNAEYVLAGVLRCARCGRAMSPASAQSRGRSYRYYRCGTKDKKGKESCPSQPLPAAAIEDYLVEQLRDAASKLAVGDQVLERVRQRTQEEREKLVTEQRELPPRLKRLRAEGKKLAGAVGKTEMPARELVEDRLAELGHEIGKRESRLAEVERRLAALDQGEVEAAWIARVLGDFDTVWGAMTVANRVRLVRALVNRVDVDEPKGEIAIVFGDLGALDGPVTAGKAA